jgi:protein TonB
MAKLASKTGRVVESPKQLLETVAYDIKGSKTENAYYPISSATLTGKEVYKYDEKGNISEMTLFNTDGSLLSKEAYLYEYDFVGNWTKMTTSVAVIENGKLSFEPTEVTYRSISYYLDEATLAKMAQQQAAPAPAASQPVATNVVNNVPAKVDQQPAAAKTSAANVANNVPAKADQQPAAAKTSTAIPPPAAASSGEKPSVANIQNAISSVSPNSSTATAAKTDAEPPSAPARTVPAPKPLLKPISGGVLNGAAISLPKPVYPDAAKNVRASGMVTVEVIIDVNGKVVSARATAGHPLLQQAAVQAAYQARFSPTTLSGQPVKVSGSINYNFALVR